MRPKPSLEDFVGIEYAKLGFFREVQEKIAELHASNIELAQKQRQIHAILNGITDVMAVLSLDFRIISVNNVFYEVFRERDPLGKLCYKVFRDQKEPCAQCPAVTARDTNQVCRELSIVTMDGQNRHFETTVSPLRDDKGEPQQLLLLKRDVTLEKEYQAKYYRAETMATIGVLAAGVGHEINNPLTAISGFTEGLKRRLPKLTGKIDNELLQDFNEYIGIILKECRRCQEIVHSLLTFSRQRCTESISINLNALIADTVKLLHNHLKSYPDGHLSIDLQDPLPTISGDPTQLKQVILNLVFNALDATADSGSVTIRTYVLNDDWIGLAVEDGGCGIPSEYLNKLFEPFFTTKPVGKGVGVGLSTCYNIVQDHRGEIVVCSQEGHGSTFLVRLPREK